MTFPPRLQTLVIHSFESSHWDGIPDNSKGPKLFAQSKYVSCHLETLILRSSITSHLPLYISRQVSASRIERLALSVSARLLPSTFSFVQKCELIQNLTLHLDEPAVEAFEPERFEPVTRPSLVALRLDGLVIDDFQRLIHAPNLEHLWIQYSKDPEGRFSERVLNVPYTQLRSLRMVGPKGDVFKRPPKRGPHWPSADQFADLLAQNPLLENLGMAKWYGGPALLKKLAERTGRSGEFRLVPRLQHLFQFEECYPEFGDWSDVDAHNRGIDSCLRARPHLVAGGLTDMRLWRRSPRNAPVDTAATLDDYDEVVHGTECTVMPVPEAFW